MVFQENRKEWGGLEQRLLAPPSHQHILAASTITISATRLVLLTLLHCPFHLLLARLLLAFEKQLRTRGEEEGRRRGLELLYTVAGRVEEEWLAVPALRHWASDLLELLSSVLLSSTPGQAPRLLTTLSSSPHLSPFLSPHFTPNTADTEEVLELYTSLAALPDGDGALPFVLLSKLDLSSWLEGALPGARSALLVTIGRCLARTGPSPPPHRSMLHGLHRRHLTLLLAASPHHHYMEVLRLLLALTEGSSLDPQVTPATTTSLHTITP